MKASFTTNIQSVLSAYHAINSGKNLSFQSTDSSKKIDVLKVVPCLFFAIVSDKSRTAILPATVGWFALTFESDDIEGAKLQVLGTNSDGYLIELFPEQSPIISMTSKLF